MPLFAWMDQLRGQASAVGGTVLSHLGNHEWMNAMGDWRYAASAIPYIICVNSFCMKICLPLRTRHIWLSLCSPKGVKYRRNWTFMGKQLHNRFPFTFTPPHWASQHSFPATSLEAFTLPEG